jgi:TRAP-type uncharacterized transport system substrate-binding protein
MAENGFDHHLSEMKLMEPLPKGANFVRGKMLWEIGLHIAGNPATRYGGNRDLCITVGSGGQAQFKPWLRLASGSAIIAEDVIAGNIEMAFVNPSAMLTQAYRGVGIFKSKLPVRIIASFPSWDRCIFAVHPRTGLTSVKEIKDKRYPLHISLREDLTHSTRVLINQLLAIYDFSVADIESWGGRVSTCGGPNDARRLSALERGELDAVFDEGIKAWFDKGLAAGLQPLDLEPKAYQVLGELGWRRVVVPAARFPGLKRDHDAIDFSGWPIYSSASLPDQVAYDAVAAIAAREAEIPWEKGGYHGMAQIGRDTEETPIDVPLHPGAERWYREHA